MMIDQDQNDRNKKIITMVYKLTSKQLHQTTSKRVILIEIYVELTDWSVKMANQTIWQCQRLKFYRVDPFMSIVDYTLMHSRSAYWSYRPVYEAKAVCQCSSLGGHSISVDLKQGW